MTKSVIYLHGPRLANRKRRSCGKNDRSWSEKLSVPARIGSTIPALIQWAHQTHRPARTNKTDFDPRRRYRFERRLAKISNPAATGRDRPPARAYTVVAIGRR